MNDEGTGKCLREVENSRDNLWHIFCND